MNAPSEKIAHDAKVLVADIEEVLKATAEQTGDKVCAARARLHAALADAKSVITLHTRQVVRATDSYVQENPWKAVGILAGVSVTAGILVGILLGQR